MIRPGYKRFRQKAVRGFFLLMGMAAVIFLILEFRLKPVIAQVGSVQARVMAVETINSAVCDILEEMNIDGESLETVSTSADGSLNAINTNTVMTNKLKNMITLRCQEALSSIRSRRLEIPLGTISGFDLLNGTGPSVPVYLSMTGTVSSDFAGEFESAGINQTVHKLTVNITAEINVIMPMNSFSETVTTSVLVGETVIIGNTPLAVAEKGSL